MIVQTDYAFLKSSHLNSRSERIPNRSKDTEAWMNGKPHPFIMNKKRQ